MRHTPEGHTDAADRTVKDMCRKTRKCYSFEEKIRIVLAGLRGEDTIAELCRQEGISQGIYYSWSKRKRFRDRPLRSFGEQTATGLMAVYRRRLRIELISKQVICP